ncbi:hypothetical protein ACRRTK_017271 [Alexandromys fortis]
MRACMCVCVRQERFFKRMKEKTEFEALVTLGVKITFLHQGFSGTSACSCHTYLVASRALAETGICASSRALPNP